jgi:hypothetical protein
MIPIIINFNAHKLTKKAPVKHIKLFIELASTISSEKM